MKLQINNTTTIRDLQEAFTAVFPFLKINFYDRPHCFGEGSALAHRYDPSFRVLTIEKKKAAPDQLVIQPLEKTGDVEKRFEELMGLYAQVCRKHGAGWIETAGTDELSLDEQNDLGKRSVELDHEKGWVEREFFL